jgi:hypothetical protein
MIMSNRISIDGVKDEDGNVLILVAAPSLTKGQQSALIEAMPLFKAMRFDGSMRPVLVGEDIVLEAGHVYEALNRVQADEELAMTMEQADIGSYEAKGLHVVLKSSRHDPKITIDLTEGTVRFE